MKTHKHNKSGLLSAVLFLSLLFLITGCDSGGGGTGDFSEGHFRIDCFRPDDASQMVFEIKGALEDEGLVEGEPLPLDDFSSDGVVYRVFEGRRGTMDLRVEVAPGGYGPLLAEGTFTVLGGSGAYAHLPKQGDFYAVKKSGELVEVFKSRLNGNQ